MLIRWHVFVSTGMALGAATALAADASPDREISLTIYNKNIADRMDLSVKTIELYRARGMGKMGAKSVAELTRMMVSRQA